MLSAEPAQERRPTESEAPPRAPHPSFVPFHIVTGVSNFRDIGGWPITPSFPSSSSTTATPHHVRRGILFRGSDTTRITPAGIAKLQELHVKVDFDLRSKQQIEKAGGFKDMREWRIERVWAPVFSDEEYTEEKARERYELYASEDPAGIVEAFIEILTSGATMMRTVMRRLLSTISEVPAEQNADWSPALFMHCTTGNNRTGIFISLLLLLLHVPSTLIVHEYTLSEQGLAPTRHINVERLLKKGAFIEYGPEEARRKCERMIGARGESMEALLEEVGRRWGGAEGYFRDVVGLSEEEVRRVREVMTAEGEGCVPGAQAAQL
ncbi:uncharacterized protein K460DRAFT_364958 [Cucurbitaria berberidis CBS 394.84]|uniref:Tyrosine specific protein phosphatases domain-containing protein n=1 Tax=Cucurbitaria berberidis CBS 394.84 TaxID=1168544 RepID=A0A9P4LCD4_9PLEO|nr:uncharacterized protein K460DRAFT_364958 [Cucurbitaria berberidis CBS 394.84]KAF1849049.1 hypothetical protein K460DRAFT_364958 [Cucurbitaria berberidis CBS 394.84]